jgi:AcrR family transcriptional regulator
MAKPRNVPRQQRSKDTYDRVLAVAARLFEERGYTGTTTNHVAEAASISVGTLYHYIPDKDALLYSLAERHLASATARIARTFTALRAEQPDLAGSLRAVIEVVVDVHIDEPRLHQLLYDWTPRSAETLEQLRIAERAMAVETAWHLQRLNVGSPNRDLVAQLIVTGLEAQVHRALMDTDRPVEAEILVDELTRLWTRALDKHVGPVRVNN